MNHSLFSHKGCGGSLLPDCTSMFSIKSPSLSISLSGVRFGVVEIQMKTAPGVLAFSCSRCDEIIKSTESDKIIVECVICHEKKEIKEMNVSREYPAFCDSCQAIFAGEKEASEELKRTFMYLINPPKSSVKPLSTVLKMKPTP